MRAEEMVRAADGIDLFMRVWLPTCVPRSMVVICHGLGDHSGRYDHVGCFLAGRGHMTFAYDHRGQGKSGGVRGHIERFSDYYRDLNTVLAAIKWRQPQAPVFVVGHSMGGLIALGFAQRHPEALTGLVASSPCLALRMQVPPAKRILGRVAARVSPRLALDAGIAAEHLSHDPVVVATYKADPVREPKVTAGFFVEFSQAMEDVTGGAGVLTVPVLIMAAGDDRLCDTSTTVRFHQQVASADKTLMVWDGMYHEIFNEPDKGKVLEVMEQWMSERISG
ncbi:MAG: lysophospholipase [Bacillota bacterium]|jgi:alpha-beta hydrolase superfamily lysophospholipase